MVQSVRLKEILLNMFWSHWAFSTIVPIVHPGIRVIKTLRKKISPSEKLRVGISTMLPCWKLRLPGKKAIRHRKHIPRVRYLLPHPKLHPCKANIHPVRINPVFLNINVLTICLIKTIIEINTPSTLSKSSMKHVCYDIRRFHNICRENPNLPNAQKFPCKNPLHCYLFQKNLPRHDCRKRNTIDHGAEIVRESVHLLNCLSSNKAFVVRSPAIMLACQSPNDTKKQTRTEEDEDCDENTNVIIISGNSYCGNFMYYGKKNSNGNFNDLEKKKQARIHQEEKDEKKRKEKIFQHSFIGKNLNAIELCISVNSLGIFLIAKREIFD